MGEFKIASRPFLDNLISKREGEEKFGERVEIVTDLDGGLQNATAKFCTIRYT